jgi:hypothetical protein
VYIYLIFKYYKPKLEIAQLIHENIERVVMWQHLFVYDTSTKWLRPWLRTLRAFGKKNKNSKNGEPIDTVYLYCV